MSYKSNTTSNRDALFGNSSKAKSGPKHKRVNKTNRDDLFGGIDKGNEGTNNSRKFSNFGSKPLSSASSTMKTLPSPENASRGYSRETKSIILPTVSGAAKMKKLKEAEDFRDKATKAMERGIFTRPDPVMAGNYYKRAADAYGLCGENRLERLHRVASADCQMGTGSYSAAATEYTKAGALVKNAKEELQRKRKEGWKFYSDAAKAWEEANEQGKAANCRVLSALAWTWEDDSRILEKQALTSLEEAVEAHVPDVLNIYSRFRQTGVSKYADSTHSFAPSKETLVLAKEALNKTPYAHESVQEVVHTLVHFEDYQSALYACGAASAMLECDGVSTMTLSRNYVMETILALSTGDPVMAERQFLDRHVQKTHYLTSRECALAEDLFRAILNRDPNALEEARSPAGSNKNALASLHVCVRDLVQALRVNGVAKRNISPKLTVPTVSKPIYNCQVEDGNTEEGVSSPKDYENVDLDSEKLADELGVMVDLDDIDVGNDDSDDDIDLR